MEEFVRAFQNFDLSGTRANIDLEELVRKEFPKQYRFPAEEAVLSPVGNQISRPQQEILDELVQALVDLDYLTFGFLNKYRQAVQLVLPKAIAEKILVALLAYVGDDEALLQSELDPTGLAVNDLMWGNDLLPIVVQRLNLLTSFDGELPMQTSIQLGEQHLFTRVLLYRLRALGQLFHGERVSDALNIKHLVRIWNFERWLGVQDSRPGDITVVTPEQFALTGNAHELFQKFCEASTSGTLFYHCPLEGTEEEARYEFTLVFKGKFFTGKNRRQFRRACRGAVEERGREISPDFHSALTMIAGRGSAEAASRTLPNRFGIQLLQLKMWMYGFYYGRIDGQYGPLSHASFLDLLEHEKQDKKQRRRRVLRALDGGYWALNLPKAAALFKDFDQYLRSSKKREEDLVKIITPENEGMILAAHAHRSQMEVSSFFQNARSRGRRIYQGLRSILAVAWRGVGRVKKWLKKGLKKIAGAVVSFLKDVFKRIREGVQVFYRAMRRFAIFVLRKPLVTPEGFRKMPPGTPVIFSRFDFDLDVTILHCEGLPPEVKKRHGRTVRNLLYGLALFLEIAALAIPLIRSLATMSWVQLGIQLGRLATRLIQKHTRLPKLAGAVANISS